RNVVVATGYFDSPNLMGIPGEDLPKVRHYYREGYPYFDQDCVVIGAGNSAVDAALDLYRSGARVTLVHFGEDLDRGVKPWVLPDIRNRIEKGEIEALWRTRVVEVRPASVVLHDDEGGARREIENDWVFAMTGYTPDPSLLRGLGVTVERETGVPAHDPETMATDVPGVYIAGVLAAGLDANKIFIENGREHGARIVRAVAGLAGGGTDPASEGAAAETESDDEEGEGSDRSVTSARGVPAS
ncbi:MAG: NAD(P)-binding domain-containing protein, partial [Gemmatimonadota bacterium]